MEHKKQFVIQKIKDMHNQSHLSGGTSIYETPLARKILKKFEIDETIFNLILDIEGFPQKNIDQNKKNKLHEKIYKEEKIKIINYILGY